MKGQANYGVNGDVFSANGRYVVGLAQFDRPATTILILETRDFWPDLGTWTFGWNYDQGGGSLPFWHSKGGNYTFADGHAKFFRLQQTIAANSFMWNLSNDPNTDCPAGSPYCVSPGGAYDLVALANAIPPAYR